MWFDSDELGEEMVKFEKGVLSNFSPDSTLFTAHIREWWVQRGLHLSQNAMQRCPGE